MQTVGYSRRLERIPTSDLNLQDIVDFFYYKGTVKEFAPVNMDRNR